LHFILLNYEWWYDTRTLASQKEALVDHELCHFRPVPEEADDPDSPYRRDENGRVLYYLRHHDMEEFREIIDRHGLYKADLQAAYTSMRSSEERNDPDPGEAAA